MAFKLGNRNVQAAGKTAVDKKAAAPALDPAGKVDPTGKADPRGAIFDAAIHEQHANGEPKTDSFGHFIRRAFAKVESAAKDVV